MRVSFFWYHELANHASDSYGPSATANASLPNGVDVENTCLMCLARLTPRYARLYSARSALSWPGVSPGRIAISGRADGRVNVCRSSSRISCASLAGLYTRPPGSGDDDRDDERDDDRDEWSVVPPAMLPDAEPPCPKLLTDDDVWWWPTGVTFGNAGAPSANPPELECLPSETEPEAENSGDLDGPNDGDGMGEPDGDGSGEMDW